MCKTGIEKILTEKMLTMVLRMIPCMPQLCTMLLCISMVHEQVLPFFYAVPSSNIDNAR